MCDFVETILTNKSICSNARFLRQHIKLNHEDIKYDHIYGSLQQQIEVTKLIYILLEVRDRLQEEFA